MSLLREWLQAPELIEAVARDGTSWAALDPQERDDIRFCKRSELAALTPILEAMVRAALTAELAKQPDGYLWGTQDAIALLCDEKETR